MEYSEKERTILDLFPVKPDSAEIPPAIFQNMDFDREKVGFLLALSQIGQETQWTGFPREFIPRLMGMRRQLQAKAALAEHESLELFDALNEAGVPYYLFDNLALKIKGLDKLPLNTGKVLIQIPRQQRDTVKKIALSKGFFIRDAEYSLSLARNNMTIIVCLDGDTGIWISDMPDFDQASETDIAGVSVPVLPVEKLIALKKRQAVKIYATKFNTDVLFYYECFLRANDLKAEEPFAFSAIRGEKDPSLIARVQRNRQGYELLKKQQLIKTGTSCFRYIKEKRGHRS